jgi:hypothetical protein
MRRCRRCTYGPWWRSRAREVRSDEPDLLVTDDLANATLVLSHNGTAIGEAPFTRV